MEVNPRIPVRNKKDSLQGTVAKAMVATLLEEPEKFELKNQGMYREVVIALFGGRMGDESRPC